MLGRTRGCWIATRRVVSGTKLCSAGAGNGEKPVAIAGSLVVVRLVSMCPIKSLANKPESGHASESSRKTERSYHLKASFMRPGKREGGEGRVRVGWWVCVCGGGSPLGCAQNDPAPSSRRRGALIYRKFD